MFLVLLESFTSTMASAQRLQQRFKVGTSILRRARNSFIMPTRSGKKSSYLLKKARIQIYLVILSLLNKDYQLKENNFSCPTFCVPRT